MSAENVVGDADFPADGLFDSLRIAPSEGIVDDTASIDDTDFEQLLTFASRSEYKDAFEEYKRKTLSRWRCQHKDARFEKTASELLKEAKQRSRVQWSMKVKKGISFESDGIPFLSAGTATYLCHKGNDIDEAKKKRMQLIRDGQLRWDGNALVRKKTRIRNTKKVGCPLKVWLARILKFPDFKVKCNDNGKYSTTKLEDMAKALKLALKTDSAIVVSEHFVMKLPKNSDHQFHRPTTDAEKPKRKRRASRMKNTVEDGDGTVETPAAETEDTRVDASIPNSSWSPEALRIYEDCVQLTKDKKWKRHKTIYTVGKEARPFMKSVHENPGKQFEYSLFYNKEEKLLRGFVQFGPWLQGGTMMVHGGAELAVLDTITGVLCYAVYQGERFVTVNLNGNFRNVLLLNTVTLVEAKVIRREGRKVFLEGVIKSIDNGTIYSDATCIFLNVGGNSL